MKIKILRSFETFWKMGSRFLDILVENYGSKRGEKSDHSLLVLESLAWGLRRRRLVGFGFVRAFNDTKS